MKVLITGGLGHIGSYISQSICDELTVVDNLSTQRYCSLFNRKDKFKFIEEDFANLTSEFLSNFDSIIHLAAVTDASESFKEQDRVFETNVTKTKAFLKKIPNSTSILFPSSTSVYGGTTKIVNEDSEVSPQSPYAESKVEIEKFLRASDLNYTIFRFGTIFGVSKGMRFHTAINKFCYQIVFDQPISVWKENINLARPYLGLHDCFSSVSKFLYKIIPSKQTYNVLTSNYRLSFILETLKSMFPSIKIDLVESPILNQMSYEVSCEKIMQYGFEPIDNIVSEIYNTIKFLK